MNPKIKHSRDRAFKRFVYIFFFLMQKLHLESLLYI